MENLEVHSVSEKNIEVHALQLGYEIQANMTISNRYGHTTPTFVLFKNLGHFLFCLSCYLIERFALLWHII